MAEEEKKHDESLAHHPVRRLRHYLHPLGRKIYIAATPEEAETARPHLDQSHANEQFDLIINGSPEHVATIKELHAHREESRKQLRERHSDLYAEFEHVHQELESLTRELNAMTTREVALDANFSKYGYSAHLRTREADSSANSTTNLSIQEKDWDAERRKGASLQFWNKPVIRQYFHKGLIWRASETEEVASFELFVDLLYVGIIAINGDRASENPTGAALLQFCVTFLMSLRQWTDLTLTISWFETNDLAQRISVLIAICFLFGFTTNLDDAFGSTYVPLVAFHVGYRLYNAVYFASIAYLIPLVRGIMVANVITILVPSAMWIGSIQLEGGERQAVIWVALIVDIFAQGTSLGLLQSWSRLEAKWSASFNKYLQFLPAVNIEHRTERTNAFVTLVFGYSVVAILYQNAAGFGINAFFGKAIMGLIQAFSFNMIYFEIDGANIFIHAIRRHRLAYMIWNTLHMPFIMSFILAAATLSRIVLARDCPNADLESLAETSKLNSEAELSSGLRWFYCGGLGIALACMGIISMTHKHKVIELQRIGKNKRLAIRFAVSIILFCLPLAELDSLRLIATTSGLLMFVLVMDIFGMSRSCDQFWFGSGQCRYTSECRLRRKDMIEAAKGDLKLDVAELSKRDVGKQAQPAVL